MLDNLLDNLPDATEMEYEGEGSSLEWQEHLTVGPVQKFVWILCKTRSARRAVARGHRAAFQIQEGSQVCQRNNLYH